MLFSNLIYYLIQFQPNHVETWPLSLWQSWGILNTFTEREKKDKGKQLNLLIITSRTFKMSDDSEEMQTGKIWNDIEWQRHSWEGHWMIENKPSNRDKGLQRRWKSRSVEPNIWDWMCEWDSQSARQTEGRDSQDTKQTKERATNLQTTLGKRD